MRISILYHFRSGPWGGGNQFLQALKKIFQKHNCYQSSPEKADILLINSFHLEEIISLSRLRQLKNNLGKIIIHRVDGPVSLVRGKDICLDRIVYDFNRLFADATIFQSSWSRKSNYTLGLKPGLFQKTILNAPDPKIFYPKKANRSDSRQRKVKIIATSWSTNWRKGFDFYQYLDQRLNFRRFQMTFVGRSPVEFKNIKHIKPQNSYRLAKTLRNHDLFLTASVFDPCSNSLIEALHCGLPAVTRRSGGHPEIVGQAGLLFDNKKELLRALEKAAKNIDKLKKQIKLPSLEEVGWDYYKFCRKIYSLSQKGSYCPRKISFFNYLRLKRNL